MKKLKLNLIGFIVFLSIAAVSCCCGPNGGCGENDKDSCSVCDTGKYTANDLPGNFASADIAIVNMTVNTESTGYRVDVFVKDNGDDDAYNTWLIVSLPVNADFISATPEYKKCGAIVKFCLGHVLYGESGPRHFTIRTTPAHLPEFKNRKETYAAYVYSTSPDPCPANNFRCWLNDSVPKACIIPDSIMVMHK